MPRYNRRRRGPRRAKKVAPSSFLSKAYKVASTAYSAYQMGSKALALLNSEAKYTELDPSAITPDYSGSIIEILSNMAAGLSGIDDFVGNQVKVTYIESRGYIKLASTPANTAVRVIWFWDKEPTTPANEILKENGTVNAPYGLYQVTHRKHVQVISDKYYHLESGINELIPFHNKFKVEKRVIWNEGQTTIKSNALRCLVITDQTGAGNLPSYYHNTRVFYRDN